MSFLLARIGLFADMPPLARDLVVLALAFLIAWLVARVATPKLIVAATKFGIYDKPDGKLKKHEKPIPYLGGIAVALGVLIALGITYRFEPALLAILLAGSIALVLGLLDDLGSLSPWQKLGGQLLAVLVLVKTGVVIELVFLPWWVAGPLSILWMLAAINAFNLIDIMDGLSSGVGAVAAAIFAGIAFAAGYDDTAFLGAALAGALIGFRAFNVEPARIYMGDAGTMFTGFLLGALAMVNDYTDEHRLGAIVPLLVLGVPLFDMLFVMWIRHRRGMPVMLGSPDHVALRLRKWRLSTKGTVRANVVAAALLGSAGVAVMILPLTAAAWLLGGLALVAIVLALWLKSIDMTL